MQRRPRRNRKSPSIRNMLTETRLYKSDLIAPVFVVEGSQIKQAIDSMPLQYRFSLDQLLFEIEHLAQIGIETLALFPVIDPKLKDPFGMEAFNPNGLIPRAISLLKKEFPHLTFITDIALDPYTDHGHDGIVNEFHEIDNDRTLEILGKQALVHAASGVDIIAPSDMMDGRIAFLRNLLDEEGFTQVSILSYAAKYASSLYFPFRDAIHTKLSFGDKKTYQLNPANKKEALLEAKLDFEEGADLLMVKPATLYLDIIQAIQQEAYLPVGGYHVSGEYAMVMAAHEKGYLNAPDVFYETLLSIKRAGASFIFSYASTILAEKFEKLTEKAFDAALL